MEIKKLLINIPNKSTIVLTNQWLSKGLGGITMLKIREIYPLGINLAKIDFLTEYLFKRRLDSRNR